MFHCFTFLRVASWEQLRSQTIPRFIPVRLHAASPWCSPCSVSINSGHSVTVGLSSWGHSSISIANANMFLRIMQYIFIPCTAVMTPLASSYMQTNTWLLYTRYIYIKFWSVASKYFLYIWTQILTLESIWCNRGKKMRRVEKPCNFPNLWNTSSSLRAQMNPQIC